MCVNLSLVSSNADRKEDATMTTVANDTIPAAVGLLAPTMFRGHRSWRNEEDGEMRSRVTYRVAAPSGMDEYVHASEHDTEEAAQALIDRIVAAGLDVSHVRTSPHWNKLVNPYGGCAVDLAPFGPAWEDEQMERCG
jgi:hypothetical protein